MRARRVARRQHPPSAKPATSTPDPSDTSTPDNDHHALLVTIYLDEIEIVLAQQVPQKLVFVNDPLQNGEYALDVSMSAVNSGFYRLEPKNRQNGRHLEAEARFHEILVHAHLWPELDSDLRWTLEDSVFAALGELDARKAVSWSMQRHSGPEGAVITDHLFQRHIPDHPHVAAAFFSVMALSSSVSRKQLRLVLASYRDSAAGSPELSHLVPYIPKDPRTIIHRMQLDPICDIFVLCPKCFALYPPSGETPPARCTHKATPRGAACREPLWRPSQAGRVPLPLRTFRKQRFDVWLARLLARPGIETLLQNAYRRPKQDPMVSDWDGDRLSTILDLDGHPFLPGPESETRLVFSWSHDGWNPYYNKISGVQHSSTGFWLVCMSLPEDIRYMEENVYYVGSLPGKPSQEQINPVLSLIVRIFIRFYSGVWFSRTAQHEHGRHVKAIVVPQVSDALATRQGAGYSVLTSRRLCIFCGIEHDDIECFDRSEWPTRDHILQREVALAWKHAESAEKRRTIFKDHGLNYTPFHELPYYNPLLDNLPDPYHLGLQGAVKELIYQCLGVNFSKPRLLRCRSYPRPEESQMREMYERIVAADDIEKGAELFLKICHPKTKAGVAWNLSWDLDLRLVGSKKVMARAIVLWRAEATGEDLRVLREKLASDDEEAALIGRPPFKVKKFVSRRRTADDLAIAAADEQDATELEIGPDVVDDEVHPSDATLEVADEGDVDVIDVDVEDEDGAVSERMSPVAPEPLGSTLIGDNEDDFVLVTSDSEQSTGLDSDISDASGPTELIPSTSRKRSKKEQRLIDLQASPEATSVAISFLKREPIKARKEMLQALCRSRGLSWKGKKAELFSRLKESVEAAFFELEPTSEPEPELEPETFEDARDLLDLSVMRKIWREMPQTILPSFMNRAPWKWGTITCGKLSSDEYFVILTIPMPITLIDMWGRLPRTERRRQVLDHIMELVDIESTFFRDSISRAETYAFDDAMVRFLETKKTLFKDVTIKVNDHTAMHYGEVLRNYGPTPSHDGSYYERFIRSLHGININMKPSELESTLMNGIVRQSNFWALLVEHAELLPHMPNFVREFQNQSHSNSRGTRLGNIYLQTESVSTDDGARYAPSTARPSVLPLHLYALVIDMRAQQEQPRDTSPNTAFARDVLTVDRVSIGGAPFASASTSQRDCTILYSTVDTSGVATHTAGRIEAMTVHVHDARALLLLFVYPYSSIPADKRHLDEHYRRYKGGGFCCLRGFDSLRVIDASSVICNVAVTPKLIDGEELMHFIPVGRLARRISPTYGYEPLSGESI
ncbi:hypothetical protein PENSPDRAFT_682395 [Peniophora sp. CONT]|nr:hypothetical protein PENSPDRAFT_682395 [Peniophora sp. CONT]